MEAIFDTYLEVYSNFHNGFIANRSLNKLLEDPSQAYKALEGYTNAVLTVTLFIYPGKEVDNGELSYPLIARHLSSSRGLLGF